VITKISSFSILGQTLLISRPNSRLLGSLLLGTRGLIPKENLVVFTVSVINFKKEKQNENKTVLIKSKIENVSNQTSP
jgi:hypothetical protein